jgi:hypothetical protein
MQILKVLAFSLLFAIGGILWVLQSNAGSRNIVWMHQAGAVADYTDIIFWWRAEAADFSGTNDSTAPCTGSGSGEDCSAGDEVVALTNATIDACGKRNNGLCGGGESYYGEVDTSGGDLFDGTSGCIAFWANTTSFDTFGRYWRWYGDANNSLYLWDAAADGNDLEVTYEGAGDQDTYHLTDSDMSTATWYFISVCFDADIGAGSDTMEIHVYDSAGTEVGNGYSGAAETIGIIDTSVNGGANNIRIGNSDSDSSDDKDVDIDGVFHSNDPSRDMKALMDTDGHPG